MCFQKHIWLLLLLSIIDARIIVKTIENCDPKANYPFIMSVKTYNRPEAQYFDLNCTWPVDMDSTIGILMEFDYVVGGRSLRILKAKENYLCDAANKYLGEPWYEACRQAKIPVKKCPIPKGFYQLTNYKFDSDKLGVPPLPFGVITSKSTVFNNKNDEVLACIKLELDNQQK
ncbi:hypothetical protein FQR65_LT09236 [Abscondita terminalis]|nr:hypothetical protein FQR65_LT09236 [Abscondita terminalis]